MTNTTRTHTDKFKRPHPGRTDQATAFNYAAHAMARAAAHEPTANPALASTGQPEPEGGELLIAAARDSLPLRSVTQQRRGTKHQTPPRNRPPPPPRSCLSALQVKYK